MTMKNKVLATIERYGMLSDGDTVIVGVSGGADSVSLLNILFQLSCEHGYNITAVHLNHMLRGSEADRDEEFVKSLCHRLGIRCIAERADCRRIAQENSLGLEECGRQLRYDLFDRIASEYKDAKIVTAHNADDNLETILLNITRGTSLKGICGIPPVRGNIIRPLIECSRNEIEQFCTENGIEYVTDSSNLSSDYSRNAIRNNVIPVLRSVNPNAAFAASRLSRLASADEELLEHMSLLLFNDAQCGNYTFDVCKLKKSSLPVRSRLYIKIYEEFTGERLPRADKIEELEEILHSTGKVQLHKNLFAEQKNGTLVFYGERKSRPHSFAEIPVKGFQFSIKTDKYMVQSVRCTSEDIKINRLLTNAYLDCDTICGELVLRGRKPGDKITLGKRKVTKSLKKLFSEEHIDEELRDIIPVLADDSGVVWVMGFGVNMKNAATVNSANVIRIEGENI